MTSNLVSPPQKEFLINIHANFPGGRIVINGIEGNVIQLHCDHQEHSYWWFQWSFECKSTPGQTLHFEFTDREATIGNRGPAISLNGGQTWSWLYQECQPASKTFTYKMPLDKTTVHFAIAIPYLQSHWEVFYDTRLNKDAWKQGTLCKSRAGRSVELIQSPTEPLKNVFLLLTARHHACESMANFVLEGILSEISRDAWWTEHVEVIVIPFVDKDGVEEGQSGKGRSPHDHNRDYNASPIYPEIKAIQNVVKSRSLNRAAIQIDLHCPYLSGDMNQKIVQVGSSEPEIWQEQQRFGEILENIEYHESTLPYHQANDVPFGESWNIQTNFSQGCNATQWFSPFTNGGFASTFEIPYADIQGQVSQPSTLRPFGGKISLALKKYIASLIKTKPSLPTHQG